jgi:hypothetical protein
VSSLLSGMAFDRFHWTRLSYRAGVTWGIVAPKSRGFLSGLSTVFTTGTAHKLQRGAAVQSIAALHVAIGAGSPSVSTQVAALRRLLLGNGHGELAAQFDDVVKVCSYEVFLECDGIQFIGSVCRESCLWLWRYKALISWPRLFN